MVMVCDQWLLDFDPFCVFLCFRFVACDRNYDWWQRETQLWRRLLNFRVRFLVKSAVMRNAYSVRQISLLLSLLLLLLLLLSLLSQSLLISLLQKVREDTKRKRENTLSLYSYFEFEKVCRGKCTRQPREVLWVVLSSLFFKEIWKNCTRGHESMFASAKGKQQK